MGEKNSEPRVSASFVPRCKKKEKEKRKLMENFDFTRGI